MANMTIAYENLIDSALLSGGSWTNAPLSNIQDRLLAREARSANLTLASTKLIIDLQKITNFAAVGIIRHNLSTNGLYRISASKLADFSVLEYDTGWLPAWPPVWPTLALEFEQDNWFSGQATDDLIRGYTPLVVTTPSQLVYARYIKIEFDDTANSAGYISLARVFVGRSWQTLTNVNYGSTVVYEDPTEVTTLLDGPEYFAERPKYRVSTFSMQWLDPSLEGYNHVMEIQRLIGISGEVIIAPDIDNPEVMLRTAYLGRLRKLSPLEYRILDFDGTQYEVKEII